jgi:hypothetical protein
MWYRVVFIGGMGGIRVLLEVLSRCINEIYNFFISIVFSFPCGDMDKFLKN